MLPEVAWIVAKHGKNVRADFGVDKAYGHVKTVVIMKAQIVPEPNGNYIHRLSLHF